MGEATGEEFQLDFEDVHIWEADFDAVSNRVSELRETLSKTEVKRADRFMHARAHDRFVLGRGITRTLLGAYLEVSPRELSFIYADSGKPSIGSSNPLDIRFNLSHSGPVALVAVTRGREIGVDVEEAGRRVSDERIARRFFASSEVEQLEALPAGERRSGFLRCWTRKEAYVKARGEGMLSTPPNSYAVSVAPEAPALLHVDGEGAEAIARWRLEDLSEAGRYIAAVCAEAEGGWRLCRRSWPAPR